MTAINALQASAPESILKSKQVYTGVPTVGYPVQTPNYIFNIKVFEYKT